MKKKFAVVLSGCGFQDGSEIHEAVMTLLAIERCGAVYQCFAPDMEQHHVTNHLNGESEKDVRNVLVESARIARGQIQPLADFSTRHFDALIFPGGFGAALNLCDFGEKGAECSVQPDVAGAVQAMSKAKKPIGALCIAPVILGRLLDGVKLTIGDDKEVEAALSSMGANPESSTHEDIVVDEARKVVTGPCYMLDASIEQIAIGAQNVVSQMMAML